ncbi:hypothetical protein ES708_20137 [subsurface metagenome]
MHFRQVHDDLAGLERGERFPRTGGVPDIAVLAAMAYLPDDGLGCIVLVRT